MRSLFTLISVFILSNACAQRNEWRLALNSGLFRFTGRSAVGSTWIAYDYDSKSGFTDNPYGSNNGLCIGVSGNFKHVLKNRFFYGVDLGFEFLRSRCFIIATNVFTDSLIISNYGNGNTYLNYSFINANPFFGYRLVTKKINLDFTGGIDVGYCLNAFEKGKFTAHTGVEYKTSGDQKTISWDFRPRVQINADYKKYGIYLGYSFGLIDYKEAEYTYANIPDQCYSMLIRFGCTYRLN